MNPSWPTPRETLARAIGDIYPPTTNQAPMYGMLGEKVGQTALHKVGNDTHPILQGVTSSMQPNGMLTYLADVCKAIRQIPGVHDLTLQVVDSSLHIVAVTKEHDPDITDALSCVYLEFHDKHSDFNFTIEQVPKEIAEESMGSFDLATFLLRRSI